MEDLEETGTPILEEVAEPEAGADPDDPLQPDIEEEHEPNAPIGDPTADPDVLEDGAPDEQAHPDNDPALDVDPEDEESDLEELDDAQFEDFDANAANIVVPIDDTNVGLIGVHKRKRTDEEERERKKKKKEGRRERVSKKSKKTIGDDGLAEDGAEGTRSRGARGAKAPRRPRTPENEDDLSPEERKLEVDVSNKTLTFIGRRRALERRMDDALRTNKPSRRRLAGESVQDQGEAELETMRVRMAQAAQKDNEARKAGQPASHKLLLLPKVVELLNRNTLKQSILDPDINVLEAVRFFLEPADEDAALPNYEIQRELFKILTGLQMTKEALIASQIGKVVMFYTKSNQPQLAIKRQAEKLLQGWMSIILNKKRSKKYQQIEKRQYDPLAASQRAAAAPQINPTIAAAEKRRKALAAPTPGNRARVEGTIGTYTVAPVSSVFAPTRVDGGQ